MTHPDLPRRAPARLVEFHPVPEYLADAALKQRYEEMKRAFNVPWMGVVAMAHAHYRRFYDLLWSGLHEIAGSSLFVEGCQAMREATEAAVADLPVASLGARLASLGYAPRELDQIRATLEAFSQGNYPYLMLATVSRHLLAGGELRGTAGLDAFGERQAPRASLVLMEAHHATAETCALYDRIKTTLALPFVNTDYRALARWPSYFSTAWDGLEPLIAGEEHKAACQRLHDSALALTRDLPNPEGLTSAAAIEAAKSDASRDEVAAMAELFQWLLPQLCVNVAVLRRQMI